MSHAKNRMILYNRLQSLKVIEMHLLINKVTELSAQFRWLSFAL